MENQEFFKNCKRLSIQEHDEFWVFGEKEYIKSEMTELEWYNLINKYEEKFSKNNPYIIDLNK